MHFISRTIGISLLLVAMANANTPSNSHAKCSIPNAAMQLTVMKFPGMHIVKLNDLQIHEQTLWKRYHYNLCPGMAKGIFAPRIAGYAISLIRPLENYKYIVAFIIIFKAGRKFKIKSLAPVSISVGHIPVVLLHRPGKFESAEHDRTIHTRWQLIEYAAMEAASIGYYWQDGSFHKIQLSE